MQRDLGNKVFNFSDNKYIENKSNNYSSYSNKSG